MSTIILYHTHTLNAASPPNYAYPSVNRIEETTRASILNSLVDLIAQPFTTPKLVERPPYYPPPTYVQTPATNYVETAPTLPPTTARPVYYTQRTYKPTPQPTQPRPTTTLPLLPTISEQLEELEAQCGIPMRQITESSGLIVNGNTARRGEVISLT